MWSPHRREWQRETVEVSREGAGGSGISPVIGSHRKGREMGEVARSVNVLEGGRRPQCTAPRPRIAANWKTNAPHRAQIRTHTLPKGLSTGSEEGAEDGVASLSSASSRRGTLHL